MVVEDGSTGGTVLIDVIASLLAWQADPAGILPITQACGVVPVHPMCLCPANPTEYRLTIRRGDGRMEIDRILLGAFFRSSAGCPLMVTPQACVLNGPAVHRQGAR